MLSNTGFDLWADGYDQSVGVSDEENSYPFAGYKVLMNEIYQRILAGKQHKVLDIGFGTATLSSKLYEQGCEIWGQDFSEKMIAIAQAKMPNASLYQGDFGKGLVDAIAQQKFDAIVATYSLHHLTDVQKVAFIRQLITMLHEGGCIYIGDVAFDTREELLACQKKAGDEWDEDEIYFVYDELKTQIPELKFERYSDCSGLLTLQK